MSGVTEVRLYRNTVNEVPAEYTNVTAAVLNSSTKNHATGVKRYLDGVATVSGLDPGINYFWVELIDARGNTAGPQPVGYVRTRNEILDTKLVEHGNNIVAEGDTIKFNGSSSYVRFVDINEAGVDYGDFLRSGTWSMTFWIKPLVDTSQEMRFFVLRQNNSGITHLTNKGLLSLALTQTPFNLTKDTWHFFAFSVEDHHWTMHKSINGLPIETTYVGVWNISNMASDRMFIGVNNGGGTSPDWPPYWWNGYVTKVTIDDRPLTGEEVTAIYNATNPTD